VQQLARVAHVTAAPDLRAAGAAETVVHLGDDVSGARRLLGGGTAMRTFVYSSTAMVYGAWPNNPVPLTEDAPVRPNPGFDYATARAEVERLALEWREATEGARLAVLRPATVLGDEDDRLTRLLRDVLPSGGQEAVPPVQYLHGDDLADAVVLAVTAGLDGVFNVAPDGWMSEEQARALTAAPLRVRLPRRLRLLRPDIPAELAPYLVHPWVVANDRLRAAGWRPRYSSEEAFVAGAGVPGWQSLSLGRRQAMALGGAAGAVAAAIAGGVAIARRRKR
jgi:nucleoside-diphosphate-sugar epimerase